MRYHSLDSLRAVMMLLGLVLHAAMSYLVVPFPVWRLSDPQRNVIFDLLVIWIHVFRMPAFFVVAGFFANLVWEKYGPGGFLQNRGKRVALVLAIVLLPMYAVVFAVFSYGLHRMEPGPWAKVWADINSPLFLGQLRLMHLWFLYYLLLFYAAVLAAKSWGPAGPAFALQRACGELMRRPWATSLVLGLPTAALLMTMPKGVLMTAQRLWPIDWNVFAAYLLFFGFGWFLYPNRSRLPLMIRGHRMSILAGSALTFGAIPWLQSGQTAPVALLMGVATWLLIFGFFGLFLRWFESPSPAMRYLSDASYWLYLAHIPVVVFGVDVLLPLAWPAIVKFSVVLLVSTPLLLTTYHLFVRNTWIGVLLNGKRADHGPRAEAPPGDGEVAIFPRPALHSSGFTVPPEDVPER